MGSYFWFHVGQSVVVDHFEFTADDGEGRNRDTQATALVPHGVAPRGLGEGHLAFSSGHGRGGSHLVRAVVLVVMRMVTGF